MRPRLPHAPGTPAQQISPSRPSGQILWSSFIAVCLPSGLARLVQMSPLFRSMFITLCPSVSSSFFVAAPMSPDAPVIAYTPIFPPFCTGGCVLNSE